MFFEFDCPRKAKRFKKLTFYGGHVKNFFGRFVDTLRLLFWWFRLFFPCMWNKRRLRLECKLKHRSSKQQFIPGMSNLNRRLIIRGNKRSGKMFAFDDMHNYNMLAFNSWTTAFSSLAGNLVCIYGQPVQNCWYGHCVDMCDIAYRNLNMLYWLQLVKENNNLDINEETDLHTATMLRHSSFVLTCDCAVCMRSP